MKPRELKRLDRELTAYIDSLVKGMGRPERRQAMADYVTGLILDGDRKSIESMAGRLVDDVTEIQAMRQRLQQCVTVSPWSDEEMWRQRGAVIERDNRIYVASLDTKRFTTAQWPLLVRSHWGVENQNHHTLDTAFVEDDQPWIEADANGMLAVFLLRRIAYTLLALYRSVALRSDDCRAIRWKALLAGVRDALVAAAPKHMMNLRVREVCAATR